MIVAVVLVVVLAAADAPVLAIVAAPIAIMLPWQLTLVGLAAAGGVAWWRDRRRRRSIDDESRILRDLAADVSAGTSLRWAIVETSDRNLGTQPRRLARTGADMMRVADAARSDLPSVAPAFVSVVGMSEQLGAEVGPALQALASQADASAALARERRVAVAQARFSAIVVGVVPMAIAASVVVLRGIPEPGGAIVVVPMAVGMALMAAGAVTVLAATRHRSPGS